MRIILGAVLMMGLMGLGEAAITTLAATRTKSLEQTKTGTQAGDFVISFLPTAQVTTGQFVIITAGEAIFKAVTTAGSSACKATSGGNAVDLDIWGAGKTLTSSTQVMQVKSLGTFAANQVASIACTGTVEAFANNPTATAITLAVKTEQTVGGTAIEAAGTGNAIVGYTTVADAGAVVASAVPSTLAGGKVPASFSWTFKPTAVIAPTNEVKLTASIAMFEAAGTTTTCKAYSTLMKTWSAATTLALEIPITSKTVDATKKIMTIVMNPSAITDGSFLDAATPIVLGKDFRITCTDNLAANPASGTAVTGAKVVTTTDTVEKSFADYTAAASVTVHGATRQKSIETGKNAAAGGDFVIWFTPEAATTTDDFVTVDADQAIFVDAHTGFTCTAKSDGNAVTVAAAGDGATEGKTTTQLIVKLTQVLAAGKVAAIACGNAVMGTAPAAAAVKFTVKTGTTTGAQDNGVPQDPKVGYTIAADAGVVATSAVPNTLVTGATPASFTWTFNPTNNIVPTNEITLTASTAMFTAAGTTMTCTAKSTLVTTGVATNAVTITSNTVDATKKVVKFVMAPSAITDGNYLTSASPIVLGHPLVLSCSDNLAANGATAATITGVKVATTNDATEKSFPDYAIAAAPAASASATAAAATGNGTAAAATGNGTATKNTAKTLTGAYTKVVQTVTFAKLDATTYKDNVKLTYECAYLDMLDATYCVDAAGSISWLTGVAIDSKAVATARRAATGSKVTFTAGVATTLKTKAQLETLVATKTANIATAFLEAFKKINVNTGFAVNTDFGAVTADAAVFTAASVTAGAGVLVPSVMAGVAAFVASLVM